jgi:CheY-like chemotaxis protein
MSKSGDVVLIVDDTPENLRVLGEMLEAEGYEVKVATDGPHALEIVESSKVDLILLDIRMPGMDGYEVCEKLKEGEGSREIPVIFLTALDAEDEEARGLKLGAVDYIAKPFKLELVKSRVVNQLALHDAREELKRVNQHLEEIVEERTQELREAHERLLNIDSAKYDFLQMIYQKIWAPELGIVDLSRKVFSQLDISDPANAWLKDQYEENQRQLFETINNALLMSGAQEGDEAPKLYPVRLDVVIADAVAKLQVAARDSGLSFSLGVDGDAVVVGDRDLLFQALTTVVNSAILLARPQTVVAVTSTRGDATIDLELAFQRREPMEEGIGTLFDGDARFHPSSVGRALGLAVPLAAKIIKTSFGGIHLGEKAGAGYSIRVSLKRFERKKGIRIDLS